MSLFWMILAMLAALLAAGFCAGMETGVMRLPESRLLGKAREGNRRAIALTDALQDTSRMITTLLVGNNLASAAFSAASAIVAVRLFTDQSAWLKGCWSFGSAIAMVFLGEYLPKVAFTTSPLKFTLAATPLYRLVAWILLPVAGVFTYVVKKGLGVAPARSREMGLSRDGLKSLVEDDDGNLTRLSGFERVLIERVLELQELFAVDLMHPGAPEDDTELRLPSTTRADHLLPAMRQSHERIVRIYDPNSLLDVGWLDEEDVLAVLTGPLKNASVQTNQPQKTER